MSRSIALSGSVTVHTSVFTIPNVGVSNAGLYQCRATVRITQNDVIYSSSGVSNTATLQLQSEIYVTVNKCACICVSSL